MCVRCGTGRIAWCTDPYRHGESTEPVEPGQPPATAADSAVGEPRRWLYGLTADEWLHLASEGEKSEVAPCCGNLGELRDLLRALLGFQSPDDTGWQRSLGREILGLVEADGDGHGLGDAEKFPLLHRVLTGIRAAGQ